ncbi:hydrogenase maturation protease [uncultured Meiothermus sp.]|jgi:hydrogenase maturation protease|uniref:hydrogenase maturation protease n=1 Tax=uncultured Meiothermus sp. TaxID=157471 RepID=UPI002611AC56|nr:hydrogenase maturation protease [uncultured Meiothermus sp.]
MILVAGFGNLLHRDDAFGVRLLERLQDNPNLSPRVRLFDAGIGGMHFVQELFCGYRAVVILDAVQGQTPGQVRVLQADVTDPRTLPPRLKRDMLADLHYAEPGRAMAMAKALDTLPPRAYIVGCVPAAIDLGIGMSPEAENALPIAEARLTELLTSLLRAEEVGE